MRQPTMLQASHKGPRRASSRTSQDRTRLPCRRGLGFQGNSLQVSQRYRLAAFAQDSSKKNRRCAYVRRLANDGNGIARGQKYIILLHERSASEVHLHNAGRSLNRCVRPERRGLRAGGEGDDRALEGGLAAQIVRKTG